MKMSVVERYDEVTEPVKFSVGLPKSVAAAKFGMSLVGNTLSLHVPRSVVGKTVKVVDLLGNVQMQKTAQSMNETMDLSNLNRGVYLVQVGDLSAKKIMLK